MQQETDTGVVQQNARLLYDLKQANTEVGRTGRIFVVVEVLG